MNKFTRFNHSVSAQAVNKVIHHLLDNVTPWLQNNWKQKKDGTFYKALNVLLDRRIETGVLSVKEEIFRDYGKRINIRVWQGYHSSDVGLEKVVFFVDATYRVVDTSGENSHSVGYVKNDLYVIKGKRLASEEIADVKRDLYGIRQPAEVQDTLLKRAEISLRIDALREQQRKIGREFGYIYLDK